MKPPRTDDDPSRAVAATVAQNVQELRLASRHTIRSLSARLAELGIKITSQQISNLENGNRGVSPDELMALAVAFEVSPMRLLLPDLLSPRQRVQVTPTTEVDAQAALNWAEGRQPLDPERREVWSVRRFSLSRWDESHPLYRSAVRIVQAVSRTLARDEGALDWLVREHEVLGVEIEARKRVRFSGLQFVVQELTDEDLIESADEIEAYRSITEEEDSNG